MRKIAVLLLFVIVFAECKDPGSGGSGSGGSGGGSASIGDRETVTVGSASFDMIYVQDQDSVTFPTGTGDSSTQALTTKFFMSETEVTNAVVAEVYQWAYDHNRFDTTNVSAHNYLSTTTVKHGGQELLDLDYSYCKVNYDGSGHFTADNGYDDHPVVRISWYGAVIFCNWLTEMRDGNAANVVYGGIATNWIHTNTTEDVTKNGYRLPGRYEWEYAARYRSDSTNTVSGYSNPWYTRGHSASDATTFHNNNSSGGGEPGKSANNAVGVYSYYWNGSSWTATGVTELATVKTKRANDLGLFDMSGNVREWCFTQSDSYRIYRGGDWNSSAIYLQVGGVYRDHPHLEYYDLGFRLCRTK